MPKAVNRDTLEGVKWPRGWMIGVPVLLLLLGLAYASWHFGWFDPPAPEPIPATAEDRAPSPPPIPPEDLPAGELQPVPVRQPPEPVRLNETQHKQLANLDVWLPWLLPFFIGGMLAWRWLRRRFVLKNSKQDPREPFAKLRLVDVHKDLFGDPQTRAALRRLHNPVAYRGRRLDVKASIHQTMKNGGLFSPVVEQLRSVPEVVILLDARHQHDHYAALGEMVAARIRALDLEVTLFRYAGAPYRLQDEQGNWQTVSPADLGRRHPRARLILIGDPHTLLDGTGRGLSAWADQLTIWPDRGLLATRNVAGDVQDLLTLAGLQFAPFSVAGVRVLSARLSGMTQVRRPEPLPPLPRILRDASLWKTAFAPARDQRRAFLAALRDYLGGPGLLVISAMAAYPGLNWNLTRALDISLLPGRMNAGERERRLLRLAQLPGCRQGHLPDWLREALLAQLTSGQHERVRRFYHELFAKTAGDDEPAIELPLALPRALPKRLTRLRERFGRRGRRLREYLHDLLRDSNQDWEDRVFASLLLGGWRRRLDFVLPRWLNRNLPGWNRLGAARPLAGALLLAVLGYLGVQQLWQQALRAPNEAVLVDQQRASHQAYTVSITVPSDLRALADSLRSTLLDSGFSVREVQAPAGGPDEAGNRLRAGAAVPDAVVRYVRARLGYLTYGAAVAIDEADTHETRPLDSRLVQVSINSPGRTGDRFHDALTQPLTADERRRFAEGPAAFEPPAGSSAALRSFRDTLRGGGQGPQMIALPGGRFDMGCVSGIACEGDELPVRQVNLPAFAIGRSEVTFADYERFARATKRELPADEGWGRGDRPVIKVSWRDARAYAAWLSEQTGADYRLPSEAEWEYAARAGTITPWHWGSDALNAGEFAWFVENSGARSHPVGSKAPNAFGLHDTAGNVWEWVQDCYSDSYDGAPADGISYGTDDAGDCSRRVLRGGGWDVEPDNLRSAFRGWSTPDDASSDVGFRLARTLR